MQDPRSPTSPISRHTSISHTIERTLSISTQTQTQTQEPQETPTPTLTSENFHPSFIPLLRHLEIRLAPLVNNVTGLTHPSFPATMLAYNLLTHDQCDALARHYDQVWPPTKTSHDYPVPIRPWVGSEFEALVDLDTKRRRIGQFIGLRGCESPIYEANEEMDIDMDEEDECGDGSVDFDMDIDETLKQMQGEWDEALKRAWREEGHRWNMK